MNIQNHRMPRESMAAYRQRRRQVKKLIDHYLRTGQPATHSRKLDMNKKPRRYVPGPHPTHKPHKVEFKGMTMSAAGVPTPHTWTVMHPGTLVKA